MSIGQTKAAKISFWITLPVLAIYIIIFIKIMEFILINRKLNFNKFYITRTAFTIIALLYVCMESIHNIDAIPDKVSSLTKNRSFYCSFPNYFNNSLLLPLFMEILLGLISMATNIIIRDRHKNNRSLIIKSFLCVLFSILLSIINLWISHDKYDIDFFQTYDEENGNCVHSSYYAVITFLYSLVCFFRWFKIKRNLNLNIINNNYKNKIDVYLYLLIPIMILMILTICLHFIHNIADIIVNYLYFIGMPIILIIFIYIYAINPIREAIISNELRVQEDAIESDINDDDDEIENNLLP